MHLFIIGQNLSEALCMRAQATIMDLSNLYPTLDPETCWTFHPNRLVFAAGISHSHVACAPREYASVTDNEVVLFDGCMVDCVDQASAHKASYIATIWDSAAGRLEGQFAAARIQNRPANIDIFTDHLAVYQVYTCRIGNAWLFSNSIHVLRQLRGFSAMEPKAAAMLVASSMIMGGYTLESGIMALSGGDRHIWCEGMAGPENIPYYRRADWSTKPKMNPTPAFIDNLAQNMCSPLSKLAETFGPLDSPLTAGRDSRVILALLQHTKTPSTFFSAGRRDMEDVEIGLQIANRLGLSHRTITFSDETIVEEWKDLCSQLIRQTDGTVAPTQTTNIYYRPTTVDRLGVLLHGAGGEFGRKLYEEVDYFWRTRSLRSTQNFLIDLGKQAKRRLINPEAVAITQNLQKQFLQQMFDEGFRLIDLLHAYFVFLRFPAWAGGNFRSTAPFTSVYSPFCTAAFAKASFTLYPMNRYSETIHYRLISHLRPDFHRLPISPENWRPQNKVRAVLKMCKADFKKKIKNLIKAREKDKVAKMPNKRYRQYGRMKWLMPHIAYYREKCLDTTGSVIWDFVDRKAFEAVVPAQPDPAEIGKHQNELFNIILLLEYEYLFNCNPTLNSICATYK